MLNNNKRRKKLLLDAIRFMLLLLAAVAAAKGEKYSTAMKRFVVIYMRVYILIGSIK